MVVKRCQVQKIKDKRCRIEWEEWLAGWGFKQSYLREAGFSVMRWRVIARGFSEKLLYYLGT